MKIIDREVLITKSEIGQSKDGKAYVTIDFVDVETGNNFNIYSKDITIANGIKPMNKYEVDLEINSTKFGLKMDILRIGTNLGAI